MALSLEVSLACSCHFPTITATKEVNARELFMIRMVELREGDYWFRKLTQPAESEPLVAKLAQQIAGGVPQRIHSIVPRCVTCPEIITICGFLTTWSPF